jgi:hypothetical protein
MALPFPLSPLPSLPHGDKVNSLCPLATPSLPHRDKVNSLRPGGGGKREGRRALPLPRPALCTEQFSRYIKYIETFIFDCAGGPVQLPVAERAPGRETQRARLHPGLRPLRGQP